MMTYVQLLHHYHQTHGCLNPRIVTMCMYLQNLQNPYKSNLAMTLQTPQVPLNTLPKRHENVGVRCTRHCRLLSVSVEGSSRAVLTNGGPDSGRTKRLGSKCKAE